MVTHGMVITNVPQSEVSRVKSMVQYWEAVASGEDPAAHMPSDGSAEAAAAVEADAHAFATAAVEAARAAVAAQEAAAPAREAAAPPEAAGGAVAEATPPIAPVLAALEASPVQSPLRPLGVTLPVGEDAATPQRTTPMHFADIPPAPACTPVSAARSWKITPISLTALRRRSNGEAQDEVRGRLQRLKADLQAAQAKLHTVDKVGWSHFLALPDLQGPLAGWWLHGCL